MNKTEECSVLCGVEPCRLFSFALVALSAVGSSAHGDLNLSYQFVCCVRACSGGGEVERCGWLCCAVVRR